MSKEQFSGQSPPVFQIRPGRPEGSTESQSTAAKWYDPQRDIAHIFPAILHSALQQMQAPTSPIAEHLLRYGMDSATVVAAAEALTKFTVGVENRDVMSLLEESGVLDSRPRDLQLIGSFVLMVLLAWYHRGWGAAHMTNENPAEELETYREAVNKTVRKWIFKKISFWRNPILWIRLFFSCERDW